MANKKCERKRDRRDRLYCDGESDGRAWTVCAFQVEQYRLEREAKMRHGR
jgi:hypothetical protein